MVNIRKDVRVGRQEDEEDFVELRIRSHLQRDWLNTCNIASVFSSKFGMPMRRTSLFYAPSEQTPSERRLGTILDHVRRVEGALVLLLVVAEHERRW